MKSSTLAWVMGAVGALVVSAAACSDDTSSAGGGTAGNGSGATSSGANTSAGGNVNTGGNVNVGGNTNVGGGVNTGGGGVVNPPTEIAPCGNQTFECGDLIDNDNDGLLDSVDPDCLGPCDNSEDSYFPDLPSNTNNSCKLDCYWDSGDGSGDDDCFWSHECDTHEVSPDFYPTPWLGNNCAYVDEAHTINPPGATCGDLFATQSQLCLDTCGPLTPNGCDCFGCCELPAGSGQFVFTGSVGANENTVCTLADVNDPTKCHPCRPVAACLNDCGPCEICIGKPEPDPGCDPGGGGGSGQGGSSGQGGGGTTGQCDPGIDPCGLPGQSPCPGGYT